MDRLWLDIAAIVIALGSAGTVIWSTFLNGPSLNFSASSVIFLAPPAGTRASLLDQILVADLRGERPSQTALHLLENSGEVREAVNQYTDDSSIINAVRAYVSSAEAQLTYSPPLELVESLLEDLDFPAMFSIPIAIHNSGGRTGRLERVYLMVYDNADSSRRWLFETFLEVRPQALIDRADVRTDVARIEGMFVGASVPSNATFSVNPMFQRRFQHYETILTEEKIRPGRYRFELHFYGADQDKLGTIDVGVFEYSAKQMYDSIQGTDIMTFEDEQFNLLELYEGSRDG